MYSGFLTKTRPSIILSAKKSLKLYRTTGGVTIVSIDAINMENPNTGFPPYLRDSSPAGICRTA